VKPRGTQTTRTGGKLRILAKPRAAQRISFGWPFVCLVSVVVSSLTTSAAAEAVRAMRFQAQTPAEARAWQEAARAKLFTLLMGGSPPARVPLDAKVLRTVEVPASRCVLEEITLQTLPDRRAHAWLARPAQAKGKVGAVLALHGHGGSGEQIVNGTSLYWYGRALIESGYVVIAPDIGQHELQHTNWTLMGERTWDALRCLDFVVTLPEVDPARLAVAGLSLGGETTMYVAALDERLKLACSSGWLTTIANMKNGHCVCYNFPGLEENFEFSDIFACVAPRLLVCELGLQEKAPGGFPVPIGREAFEQLRAAYRVFNAESNLTLSIHSGPHVFSGKDFWPLLRRTLGAPASASLIPPPYEAFPEMRKAWDTEARLPASLTNDAQRRALYRQAEKNSRLANEAFFRCRRYIDGWLAHCDTNTGLFPRNLRESNYWNGRDSAADNYPFMVLTAAMTDRPLMDGRLLDILRTETRLTCRLGHLPDDYSFATHGWRREKLDLDAMIFDGAEYVKDGLLYIAEWLGPSPWSERMVGITEDLWQYAPVETPYGKIPTLNFEVCGDMLQASARMFWFTGDRKYLDCAVRLGDYFLLGTNHPTRNMKQLRLSDHGCEVINGLSELYVAVSYAMPEKKKAYEQPIHEMFACILAKGCNPDGLFYVWFNPQTGEHSPDLCDTWGYDYDGVYTLWLLDKTEAYRDAVRKALGNLRGKYIGACWADKSADGFADSIEGAINLFNREPDASAADWADTQTRMMWSIQKPDGIIEGWHGDGNVARTSLMYALWKTQGTTVQPWRSDVRFGAVRDGGTVYLCVTAGQPWDGRLVFDRPRHKLLMHLPLDYTRINQFPEWFTAQPEGRYEVKLDSQHPQQKTGVELAEGIPVQLKAAQTLLIEVSQ
jgi:hypothetical protein